MSNAIEGPIGIVAGNGIYPIDVAKEAKRLGLKVVVIGHIGEASEELVSLADVIEWVHVGQLGRIIKLLKKHKVKSAAFAGGIRRLNFLGALRLDLRALKLVAKLGSVRDDALLSGISAELELEGFRVFAASEMLKDAVPSAGYLTARKMSPEELADARVGWEVAKGIGSMDIGQTVVAYQQLIVAVEAIEGTDATIARAGAVIGASGRLSKKLKKGHGPIVVKLSKPQQDLRLDLPAIGPATIQSLINANISGLVLEAGKCLILGAEEVLKLANDANISIIAAGGFDDLAGPAVVSAM
jgi:UDP-2,3-diacylglucosamine hydrolase